MLFAAAKTTTYIRTFASIGDVRIALVVLGALAEIASAGCVGTDVVAAAAGVVRWRWRPSCNGARPIPDGEVDDEWDAPGVFLGQNIVVKYVFRGEGVK